MDDDFIPGLLHRLGENLDKRTGVERGRPASDPYAGVQTYLYLRTDVVDWLNAEAARQSLERHTRITRSQVVLQILREKIDAVESKASR